MVSARGMWTVAFWCLVVSGLLGTPAASVRAAEPIKVGLVAALSGQSAKSGEGITRGLTIAIDEINARGGLLGGRQLTLIRRDDESNPSKGQIAARELIFKEGVVALFGGIDSPVSLAIVPLAHIEAAGVEKFEANDVDMVPQLSRLKAARADVIFLVANAAPGAQMMKSLERMEWTVPVVSHWGISGGRFPELAGKGVQHVEFIQTYSFFGPQSVVGQRVLAALQAKYPDIKGPGDVTPPVGVANAYDAVHLMALAIAKAGSTDGDKIRQSLYAVETYEGLM
jgi:ABC-type branched-subunit amino acid transport system substrate-binding protein